MTRGFFRRGQPLMALFLVLGSWVSARAMMWDAGGAPHASVVPPPAAAEIKQDMRPHLAGMSRAITGLREMIEAPAAPHLWDEPLFDSRARPFDDTVTVAGTAYPLRSQRVSRPAARSPRTTLAAAAPVAMAEPVEARTAGEHRPLWMSTLNQAPAAAAYAPPPENVAPYPVAQPVRPAERRWSADGWMLWRRGSGQTFAAGGFAPSYGASQAGAVLRYRLATGSSHRPAAFLRATAALNGTAERELALGLQARPFGGIPVVLAAEARATAQTGRTLVRPAVFAVTELPPVELPLGLRGEAYAQGGYVGGKFATAFADGQLRVDRRLLGLGRAEMRLGGGVWGGAQKGASRLDAGPSLMLATPLGGPAAMRLAADWRFRVAGKAAPGSGPAVTLSAGF